MTSQSLGALRFPLPAELAIPAVTTPVHGVAHVPGSKSYSNRALPIAALAAGESMLCGLLDSEDTQFMLQALQQLGVRLEMTSSPTQWAVTGCDGRWPAAQADLFLGNSGTSVRFLTALVTLGVGTFRLDGVPRMRQRPLGDLLAALQTLGVAIAAEQQNDCPPVVIQANGLPGGSVQIRGDVSSQFLSGLLLAAPLAQGPLRIELSGELVSKPYIDMTLAVMHDFGVGVDRVGYERFSFPGQGRYEPRTYWIEPDASAASYFFALAALTAGSIRVPGLGRQSLQGDLQFISALQQMGCIVEQTDDATTVRRLAEQPLRGIDIDMNQISDTVPTLAVVACFADSPTRIRQVAHIRVKECDRINALAVELRKIGAKITEHDDGLTIEPTPPYHAATFDTYEDHRLAMSLALVGLNVPGIVIRDPSCTAKTYPQYFQDLFRLIQS